MLSSRAGISLRPGIATFSVAPAHETFSTCHYSVAVNTMAEQRPYILTTTQQRRQPCAPINPGSWFTDPHRLPCRGPAQADDPNREGYRVTEHQDLHEAPIYAEHAPHPKLARYVECYWSITGHLPAEAKQASRVLPDGCIDFLFNLGDSSTRQSGLSASPTVIGSMTRAVEVEYAGQIELVGVRFRPGGATPYLGLPASELTDHVVGLEEIWGAEAGRTHERLSELDTRARIALLDETLMERLRSTAHPADGRVLHASETVVAHEGSLPVARLVEETGLGRRQLERRFLACVGVSPKTASRIARFRAAVATMHADPTVELSRLALGAGYADQAHMNRDFRALAGVTPGTYLTGLGDL